MRCPGCGKLTDWAHDVKLCTRIAELEQQLETVTDDAYSAAAAVAREVAAKWDEVLAHNYKKSGSAVATLRVRAIRDACTGIARAIDRLKEN